MAVSNMRSPGAAGAPSPFSHRTFDHMPSASSLVEPAVAFPTAHTRYIAPMPGLQTEPDTASNLPSSFAATAAGFSFDSAKPVYLPAQSIDLRQPEFPEKLDLQCISSAFSEGMSVATPSAPTTPIGASNSSINNEQFIQKQSPFPGVGSGVQGSSALKHAGIPHDRFGSIWAAL